MFIVQQNTANKYFDTSDKYNKGAVIIWPFFSLLRRKQTPF